MKICKSVCRYGRSGLAVVLLLTSTTAVKAANDDSEMIRVPSGPFVMGSDRIDKDLRRSSEIGVGKPLFVDEHPQHTIDLPTFYIDRYEAVVINKKAFELAITEAKDIAGLSLGDFTRQMKINKKFIALTRDKNMPHKEINDLTNSTVSKLLSKKSLERFLNLETY